MSQRFFTADWHLGCELLVESGQRPFKSVYDMNETIISNCNSRASIDDYVIHIGDLCQFGTDRGSERSRINPQRWISRIDPTFINVLGNHDPNNRVKSICSSMRTSLGPFKSVSIGHYPSFYSNSSSSTKPGDIRLCGHVHGLWKYYIDKENLVLNINCGVDVWNYNIVSEDELISFISKLMKKIRYNNSIYRTSPKNN